MRGAGTGVAVPLALAGVAMAAAPAGAQLVAAAVGIGLLGLPHGASDLLAVAPPRRPGFVAAYLAVAAAATGLWLVAPAAGLLLLLALSASHFASDHAPGGDGWTHWAIGLLLVAGPALLHRDALARLFADLLGAERAAAVLVAWLLMVGAAAALLWMGRVALGHHRPTAPELVGLAALVGLPPLLGFTVGFVVLHAWPELHERRREFGCPTLGAYLRLTAPVLAGATLVVGVLALLFAAQSTGSSRLLFAAIAALAIPHMLVTPRWRERTAVAARPA